MNLIVNLPPVKVWVRKEYLTDHQSGHGDFVEGFWVTAKSLPGRTFYFETYLPEYAALYDKLPISAFLNEPKTPTPDLPLDELQFWNCMDHGVHVIEKQFIGSMGFEIFTKSKDIMRGKYLFTLDNYHPNHQVVDCNVSETPQEHKSHNCIELDNGQFALYPNNRMRMYDTSLTPDEPLTPDFKVSTKYYEVENQFSDWGRLGHSDEYFWKTKREEENGRKKTKKRA